MPASGPRYHNALFRRAVFFSGVHANRGRRLHGQRDINEVNDGKHELAIIDGGIGDFILCDSVSNLGEQFGVFDISCGGAGTQRLCFVPRCVQKIRLSPCV